MCHIYGSWSIGRSCSFHIFFTGLDKKTRGNQVYIPIPIKSSGVFCKPNEQVEDLGSLQGFLQVIHFMYVNQVQVGIETWL